MPTLALEQAVVEGRTLPSHLGELGVPLTVEISTMSRPWASLPTTTNLQVRQLLDLRPAGRMPGPAAAQVRLKKPRKVEAPVANLGGGRKSATCRGHTDSDVRLKGAAGLTSEPAGGSPAHRPDDVRGAADEPRRALRDGTCAWIQKLIGRFVQAMPTEEADMNTSTCTRPRHMCRSTRSGTPAS